MLCRYEKTAIGKNTKQIITQFSYCIRSILYVSLRSTSLLMQLMMYLGNDLIESVPVNEEHVSQPGYLGKFKRMLKEKYAELIAESEKHPEFLVTDITPSSPSTSEQS